LSSVTNELKRLGSNKVSRLESTDSGPFLTQAWGRLGVPARKSEGHRRLAYTELLADEKTAIANCFSILAAGWLGRNGVTINWVMTDNGGGYWAHLIHYRIHYRLP
jgi:hypothetical protein